MPSGVPLNKRLGANSIISFYLWRVFLLIKLSLIRRDLAPGFRILIRALADCNRSGTHVNKSKTSIRQARGSLWSHDNTMQLYVHWIFTRLWIRVLMSKLQLDIFSRMTLHPVHTLLSTKMLICLKYSSIESSYSTLNGALHEKICTIRKKYWKRWPECFDLSATHSIIVFHTGSMIQISSPLLVEYPWVPENKTSGRVKVCCQVIMKYFALQINNYTMSCIYMCKHHNGSHL